MESQSVGDGRNRDWELVRYVGRHGVVAMRHVMAALGVGRTAAYRRVATCVEAGLLERLDLVRSEPGLLRATRDGLRYAGLGLPVAVVSPGAVDHLLRCATTAQLARRALRPRARPHRARAGLGRTDRGAPDRQRRGRREPLRGARAAPTRPRRPHRRGHDRDRGRADPEVPAPPARHDPRLAPDDRSAPIAEVHYHCAPGQTRRAVERAAAKRQRRAVDRDHRGGVAVRVRKASTSQREAIAALQRGAGRGLAAVLQARYPHLSFEIAVRPDERDRWPSRAALDR